MEGSEGDDNFRGYQETVRWELLEFMVYVIFPNTLKPVTAIYTIFQTKCIEKSYNRENYTRGKPFHRDSCAIEAVNSGRVEGVREGWGQVSMGFPVGPMYSCFVWRGGRSVNIWFSADSPDT